jgi:hypothetical protein
VSTRVRLPDVAHRESLENQFIQRVKGSISFMEIEQRQPQRVLDLGCGVGHPPITFGNDNSLMDGWASLGHG